MVHCIYTYYALPRAALDGAWVVKSYFMGFVMSVCSSKSIKNFKNIFDKYFQYTNRSKNRKGLALFIRIDFVQFCFITNKHPKIGLKRPKALLRVSRLTNRKATG